MKERRKKERRRWGRKVTYPFIDSDGVLVTKNRRRKIDRRDVTPEEELAATESEKVADPSTPSTAAKEKSHEKKSSVDISESKVMELEDALKDANKPASGIMASIKDLENEILNATNIEAVSNNKLEAVAKKEPSEEIISVPKKPSAAKEKSTREKVDEIPEIDDIVNAKLNRKSNDMSIELFIKGKKHVLTVDKNSCQVGRDPSCDIVIQNKFVSRAHAKILFKDGKFFVEDNSYNGTYIKFNNGQKIHVSKDEQTLASSGVMSMGKPVDDESKSVIEFKINQ
jgi:hypothetical protein